MRERALKAKHMESMTRKITLQPEDLAAADLLPVKAISVIPVSYTHLRAHETVLDIVCRLLLEKKKKLDSITRSSLQSQHHQHTQY